MIEGREIFLQILSMLVSICVKKMLVIMNISSIHLVAAITLGNTEVKLARFY